MKKSLSAALKKLPEEVFSNDTVFFRHIETEQDLAYAIFDCKLREDQRDLVTAASFSIGRAYLKPRDNYPCVVCTLDGTPIGFINLLRWLGLGEGVTWSLYLDADAQGKGYGKAAAKLAVRILKTAFPDEMLKLSVVESNTKARALYLSLGFRLLDELDIDDLVYGLD
ncbi:MAG: GNAT family N-acetyltransferase [Oscillospiraceae bacterium]|nr:GNAT family N-acetyltransferase [Oscillospiraceae bacterium]